MRVWQFSSSVRLVFMIALVGSWLGVWVSPAGAEEGESSLVTGHPALQEQTSTAFEESQPPIPDDQEQVINTPIPQLSEVEQPATTVTDWIAQIEASLVQITDVRVEATEAGLQVILETEDGVLEVPETRAIGNALIADISNAAIAEEFSQAEPIEGIALVNVTSLPGGRVRVAITGSNAPPVVEVASEAQGLAFAVTLGDADSVAEEDAIQVVVTGEQDEGYNPSSASTATRTDTPLRDIPQSIQVVPRQVLEDRNVRGITEAVETVSGVVEGADTITRIIRGFNTDTGGSASQLQNSFRIGGTSELIPQEPVVGIEQVEVLKGPSSVLYGALEPGGVINIITRQPLSEPYYNLGLEVGSPGFYQPSVDLSGPLTTDNTVLYRLIAAYNGTDGYFEGGGTNNTFIAPSIALNLGERTDLNLYYEFSRFTGDIYGGLYGVALSDGSISPRDINVWGNPSLTFDDRQSHEHGFRLEHDFNDNLQLRGAFSANNFRIPEQRFAVPIAVTDDRFVEFFYLDRSQASNVYFGQIDLLSRFNTGSIAHQLVVGFDIEDTAVSFESFTSQDPLPALDLLNPTYNVERPTDLVPDFSSEQQIRSYGVYLQDQIEFSDQWNLLIGGRYDWVSNEFENTGNSINEPVVADGAFSPRIGLVYQPTDTVSLYASYSRSFVQTTSFSPDQIFEPTRGTQYEVGVRTDFLDERLSANLAAYHLTKTNVTTADPNNPLLSVQTGEQRSQGIELDVSGEILPGWNVAASYAYTDAEVTEDNSIPVGNRLNNVPFN